MFPFRYSFWKTHFLVPVFLSAGWTFLGLILPADFWKYSNIPLRFQPPVTPCRPIACWPHNQEGGTVYRKVFNVSHAAFPFAESCTLIPLENKVNDWFGNVYVDAQGGLWREEGRYGNLRRLSKNEERALFQNKNTVVYWNAEIRELFRKRLPQLQAIPHHVLYQETIAAPKVSWKNPLIWKVFSQALLYFGFLISVQQAFRRWLLLPGLCGVAFSLGAACASLLLLKQIAAETSLPFLPWLLGAGWLSASLFRCNVVLLPLLVKEKILLTSFFLLTLIAALFFHHTPQFPFDMSGDIWRYVQQAGFLHFFQNWPRNFFLQAWNNSLVVTYPYGMGLWLHSFLDIAAAPKDAPLQVYPFFPLAYFGMTASILFLNALGLLALLESRGERRSVGYTLSLLAIVFSPFFRLKISHTGGEEFLLYAFLALTLAALDAELLLSKRKKMFLTALFAAMLPLAKQEGFVILFAVFLLFLLEKKRALPFFPAVCAFAAAAFPATFFFLKNKYSGLYNAVFDPITLRGFIERIPIFPQIALWQFQGLFSKYFYCVIFLLAVWFFLHSRVDRFATFRAFGKFLAVYSAYFFLFTVAFSFSNYPSVEKHAQEFRRLSYPFVFLTASFLFQGRLGTSVISWRETLSLFFKKPSANLRNNG